MNILLKLCFLFFIGSLTGWVLEVFYRRYFSSANPEKKWINPGFCTGPYLPLYGLGLCMLYLLASLEKYTIIENVVLNKCTLFLVMAICMTVIEYIAGVAVLKIANVRLWDYFDEWANIDGIICPKFSFYWAVLGAIYYFFIHRHILDSIDWLSRNLAFSFFVGLFFGVFIIDVCHSANLVAKFRQYAKENDIVLRYETIKANIRSYYDRSKKKYSFFRPFRSDKPLSEHLSELRESFEMRRRK